MSTPTTEVTLVTLRPDADVYDKNSHAGKIMIRSNEITLAQPGCMRLWWCVTEEDPHLMVITVDWETIEDHDRFESADGFASFMDDFNTIVGGPIIVLRFRFDMLGAGTTPSNKFSAPWTEMALFYFPLSDATPEKQAEFSQAIEEFEAGFSKIDPPHERMAGAWAVEESIGREGVGRGREKPWVGFWGWNSSEEHKQAAESDFEKQYEHLWFGGNKDLFLRHLKFFQVEK